jgi:tight adherence protein C
MSPILAGALAALIFGFVALTLTARELTEHRLAERVRRAAVGAVLDNKPKRSFVEILQAIFGSVDVSGLTRFLVSPQDRTQVERTIVPLGIPAGMAGPILGSVKLMFLIAGPAVAFAYHVGSQRAGSPAIPIVFGLGIGVLLPNMIISQLRKKRIATLNRGMADTLDMLVVCAEAGLGLESAIDRVAADLRKANPAMAMEFAQLSQEMRLLPDRSAAMERFAERADVDGLRRVAATLSQAMRYGTPLGQALRALAADERQARLIRLEEKAARLPALLVLPLILFILPPLFLLLVGPSILTLFDAIGAMK